LNRSNTGTHASVGLTILVQGCCYRDYDTYSFSTALTLSSIRDFFVVTFLVIV